MMIHCISWVASMRAGRFLCFGSGRIWGEDLVPVGCILAPPPVALAAVRSGAVVLLLLTFCLLLRPLWGSVVVLCFVVCCFVSILVLRSSWCGGGGWLLCLVCLPGVSWWLGGSSARLFRAGLSAVCDCGIS